MGIEYSAGYIESNSRALRRLALSTTVRGYLVMVEISDSFDNSSPATVTNDNQHAYKEAQAASTERLEWANRMLTVPEDQTCPRGWFLTTEISETNRCTNCHCKF